MRQSVPTGKIKPTEKQRKFIQAYMGKAQGNATEAARIAGYKSPEVEGCRLLKNAKISSAIEKQRNKETKRAIMSREERQEVLSDIAWNAGKDRNNRIKAIDTLNKMDGLYIQRHSVDINMPPEQIEEAVVALYKSNSDLWKRVKWRVEG